MKSVKERSGRAREEFAYKASKLRSFRGGVAPDYEHRQVKVNFSDEFGVDEAVADVIEFLIENGAVTLFSCQGERGNKGFNLVKAGYIYFASSCDMRLGLDLLAAVAVAAGDLRLAERVLGGRGVINGAGELGRVGMGRFWWLHDWRYEFERSVNGVGFSENREDDLLCRTVRFNYEDGEMLGKMIRERR